MDSLRLNDTIHRAINGSDYVLATPIALDLVLPGLMTMSEGDDETV
jgi:hypothetical protein